MAANRIQAVRLALVEILSTIPGWSTPYAYWPGAVVTPCVVVGYASDVTYRTTLADHATFTITLVAAVSRADGPKLDEFLAPDGPFYTALDAAKNPAWKSCRVTDGGDPRIVTATMSGQTVEVISADLSLSITA